MTLSEFYEALAIKTREKHALWSFTSDGEIRSGWHCPLSFVAGTTPCQDEDAGTILGLDEPAWAVISAAADDEHGFTDEPVREALLRACALDGDL